MNLPSLPCSLRRSGEGTEVHGGHAFGGAERSALGQRESRMSASFQEPPKSHAPKGNSNYEMQALFRSPTPGGASNLTKSFL
jgi:hypothetical protein